MIGSRLLLETVNWENAFSDTNIRENDWKSKKVTPGEFPVAGPKESSPGRTNDSNNPRKLRNKVVISPHNIVEEKTMIVSLYRRNDAVAAMKRMNTTGNSI
jgi:hypothetical protein